MMWIGNVSALSTTTSASFVSPLILLIARRFYNSFVEISPAPLSGELRENPLFSEGGGPGLLRQSVPPALRRLL